MFFSVLVSNLALGTEALTVLGSWRCSRSQKTCCQWRQVESMAFMWMVFTSRRTSDLKSIDTSLRNASKQLRDKLSRHESLAPALEIYESKSSKAVPGHMRRSAWLRGTKLKSSKTPSRSDLKDSKP